MTNRLSILASLSEVAKSYIWRPSTDAQCCIPRPPNCNADPWNTLCSNLGLTRKTSGTTCPAGGCSSTNCCCMVVMRQTQMRNADWQISLSSSPEPLAPITIPAFALLSLLMSQQGAVQSWSPESPHLSPKSQSATVRLTSSLSLTAPEASAPPTWS